MVNRLIKLHAAVAVALPCDITTAAAAARTIHSYTSRFPPQRRRIAGRWCTTFSFGSTSAAGATPGTGGR